jgi:ABC-type uncharacterized transport system substrate-binding protein
MVNNLPHSIGAAGYFMYQTVPVMLHIVLTNIVNAGTSLLTSTSSAVKTGSKIQCYTHYKDVDPNMASIYWLP